ncbi:MAG: response regulator [Proteobacteria bacterium]|nr:response regulator [Pseudomonadota bacterium]
MPKIFIADDDREMRSMLGASLRREGFDVQLIDSGVQLLAELDAARAVGQAPDLVITDLRMPGIDGLEVLRHVQTTSPSLPVILITAFGDRRTHERAHSLGAAFVIDKPFQLGVLRDQVEALIRSR